MPEWATGCRSAAATAAQGSSTAARRYAHELRALAFLRNIVRLNLQFAAAGGAQEIKMHSWFGWCKQWDPVPTPVPDFQQIDSGEMEAERTACRADLASCACTVSLDKSWHGISLDNSSSYESLNQAWPHGSQSMDEEELINDGFYYISEEVRCAERAAALEQ